MSDVDRDDRRDVEIVHARGARSLADFLRPGCRVAGADVEKVRFRVVGHAVPERSSAAVLPPFSYPGFGGLFHGLVLEAVGRVPRHGPETPDLAAVVDVVRREISPKWWKLGAGETDDDLVPDDAGRHGQRIGFGVGRHGQNVPEFFSGFGIESGDPSIDDRHVDLALVDPCASIHHAAAQSARSRLADAAIDPGVVTPQLFAGDRVPCDRNAPVGNDVEPAIVHHGRRFLASGRIRERRRPDRVQSIDVRRVDPIQGAVARFLVVESHREPLAVGTVGVHETVRIDDGRVLQGCGDANREEDPEKRDVCDPESVHCDSPPE